MSKIIDKALKAKRESKYVDFKSSFDPTSAGEWCELLKDIVAMANSGGGVIVVGLDNKGEPSGVDVTDVLTLDHATIVDKVRKYTGKGFSDVEIHEAQKGRQTVAIMEVSAVEIPMIFQNVGTYQVGPKKQRTAFSRGSVYFRHGAKSEPGTSDDLRDVVDRNLETIRNEWLEGVRKVVKAPPGSTVTVFKGEVRESRSPDAAPIRLVDDYDAPGYRLIDHDTTYPYRQKEVIEAVNRMLPDAVDINTYDVLAVRRAHGIDEEQRFSHHPKFGSPQYSEAFVTWLVENHKEDSNFFVKAREAYYAKTYASS